jgi:hypothetical protein
MNGTLAIGAVASALAAVVTFVAVADVWRSGRDTRGMRVVWTVVLLGALALGTRGPVLRSATQGFSRPAAEAPRDRQTTTVWELPFLAIATQVRPAEPGTQWIERRIALRFGWPVLLVLGAYLVYRHRQDRDAIRAPAPS